MTKYLSRTAIFLFLVIASGCAHPVTTYYKDVLNGENLSKIPSIEKCAEPELVLVNTDKDYISFEENGWIVIGASNWNGPLIVTDTAAKEKALENKACLITYFKKYDKTVSGNMPLVLPNNQTSYTNYSGNVGNKPIYGTGTTTTYGTTTSYIPYSVDRYEHEIGFWVKKTKFRLGIKAAELNDEARKIIQSNKGVLIELVIKNTPAYNADILKDDIIVKIGDVKITDLASFHATLESTKSGPIQFSLTRNGLNIVKTVVLGDL